MLKKKYKKLKPGVPIYIDVSLLQKMIIVNVVAEHKILKLAINFAKPNFY